MCMVIGRQKRERVRNRDSQSDRRVSPTAARYHWIMMNFYRQHQIMCFFIINPNYGLIESLKPKAINSALNIPPNVERTNRVRAGNFSPKSKLGLLVLSFSTSVKTHGLKLLLVVNPFFSFLRVHH